MKVTLIHDRRRDGKNTLEYKIYFPEQKKTVYISTHIGIEREFFDKELRVVSPEVKDYVNIKNSLKLIEYKIKDVLAELSVRSVTTKEDFVREFKRRTTEEAEGKKHKDGNFNSFMYNEIQEDNTLSEGTKENHLQTYKLLNKYRKIRFRDINFRLATDLNRYFRTKYKNLNTINKHFTIIKRYVKLASRYGLIKDASSFNSFKAIKQEVHKEIVTPEEINKIIALNYAKDSNEYYVKNMFVFSFFTGLRLSDVVSLRSENFKQEDGLILEMNVKKLQRYGRRVKQNLSKSFSGEPEKIIKPFLKEGKIFKTVPDILRYLKKITKDAGIDKHITFHDARRSGLTWVANVTGDMFSVMQFGGITNTVTAMRYVKLSERMFSDKINEIAW